MCDIQKLTIYRGDILRAEIAGWFHNIGKLDPNFLVGQTEESQNILGTQRIPALGSEIRGEYSINRFSRPKLLKSTFPYEDRIGVLFLPNTDNRKKVEQKVQHIEGEIAKIQEKLKKTVQSSEKKHLGIQLSGLKEERSKALRDRDFSEKDVWEQYELKIEECILKDLSNWPLGSLLTMFWEKQWFDKPDEQKYLPGSIQDPDYNRAPKKDIRLESGFSMDLPSLLLLAHGEVSGQEKKGMDIGGSYVDIKDYRSPDPTLNTIKLATVFGYESPIFWYDWQEKRKDIVDWVLAYWNTPTHLLKELKKQFVPFAASLGDTRRPINEISLWDYSASTAALFKTAIAEYFLTSEMPTPANMRWRLASVRMDAFEFLFQSAMLSDLLARQSMLKSVQRIIQHALEVEVPVGSTAYTDEDGLVFVLPKFQGLDEKLIENKLTALLEKALDTPTDLDTLDEVRELYGVADIRPRIQLYPPQRGKLLNLQQPLTKKEPIIAPNPKQVSDWWNNTDKERCTVCGLRPFGYLEPGLPGFVNEEKAKKRKVCGICLARRGRKAQEWMKRKSGETIWIDEIADAKARVALIIGRFDLSFWLDGTLVRTLAVGTDDNGVWIAKAPTFSRVKRIWETTEQFWRMVCPTDEYQLNTTNQTVDEKDEVNANNNSKLANSVVGKAIGQNRSRLEIRGTLQTKRDSRTPGDYHACDLVLSDDVRISVVWDPDSCRFTTADNLEYIEEQLGRSVESELKELAGKRDPLIIEEPTGYDSKKDIWGTISLDSESVSSLDIKYTPAIPILAEPRTFMALVPADKALDVIQAIKAKYESEMGKVRNRLPLSLGVVYAHRRTPLRAILDAGRRMLDQYAKSEGWKVLNDVSKLINNGDMLPNKYKNDLSGQLREWYEILLAKDGRQFKWCVPAVMGDGTTPDLWYPYVFLDALSEPSDRDLRFQAPNPWTDSDGWLVHAGKLKKDDVVYFTPATLDFQWLDSAGRRFEISYDEGGRRRGLSRRPYLLDELGELEHIWETLKHHLSKNQIYALRDLIEAKRTEWQEMDPDLAEFDPQGELIKRPEDVFWQFCYNALANAEWRDGEKPWQVEEEDRNIWLAHWANYLASGWFTDVVELHLQIMKEEVQI